MYAAILAIAGVFRAGIAIVAVCVFTASGVALVTRENALAGHGITRRVTFTCDRRRHADAIDAPSHRA
jgi:hypothetical protein